MNRKRRKKYERLKQIRRERDYHSGVIRYANRPITFRSITKIHKNGRWVLKHVTTKEFMRKHGIII